MKGNVFWIAAIAAATNPCIADAEDAPRVSLKVREARAYEEGRLQEDAVAYVASACEKDIPGEIIWEHFPTDDSLFSHSVAGYCGNGFGAVAQVCGSALGKEAVQQTINRITCHFGAIDQTTITEEGEFKIFLDWEEANLQSKFAEFLRDNL